MGMNLCLAFTNIPNLIRPASWAERLIHFRPLFCVQTKICFAEHLFFLCCQGIVRRAVALGRYVQNPLAMVATLCGPEREILSVKLSPFENFLTPDGSMQWLNRLW